MISSKLTVLVLLAGVVLVFSSPEAQDQYPPAGYDMLSTTATIHLYAEPDNPASLIESIDMTGHIGIFRGDPYDDGGVLTIDTRILDLVLSGYSDFFGAGAVLALNPFYDSGGEIAQITPGIDFPAESFFDVYYLLTLTTKSGAVYTTDLQGSLNVDLDAGEARVVLDTTEMPLIPDFSEADLMRISDLPGSKATRDRANAVYCELTGNGAAGGGGIYAGETFQFVIGMEHSEANLIYVTNGFKIYSPEGATWAVPVSTADPDFCAAFDLLCVTFERSVTGSGADSIAIGAQTMALDGHPPGVEIPTLTIETSVSEADIGKTLCIDSCFMPTVIDWTWGLNPGGSVWPSWYGPHCYDILPPPTDCEDTLSYHGPATYAWNVPHSSGITEFGERFTSLPSSCCTLAVVLVDVFGDYIVGSPDMVVSIYADNGSGLPGALLASRTVYNANLPSGWETVAVNFRADNLVFCGSQDFHIGVSCLGDIGTLVILTDDGSGGSTRPWTYWIGDYYTMLELYGTAYQPIIKAVMCCESPALGPYVNIEPAYMSSVIYQIPPYGRLYTDPVPTALVDEITYDTVGWVIPEHRIQPPPGGAATLPVIGTMELIVGPAEPSPGQAADEVIELTGTADLIWSDTYIDPDEKREIQTEILSMNLTGESQLFGTAILQLPFPSPGLATASEPGDEFFPAESFFDVYYEVEFPDIGQTTMPYGAASPHVEADIEAMPPFNRHFTTDAFSPRADVGVPSAIMWWVRPDFWFQPVIVEGGCCDRRGDINHDGTTEPDIADLVYLVTYMFQDGPPPVCDEPYDPDCSEHYYAEADIDGNGTCNPDIADLVYLVTYMFQEGPALVPCP